MENDKKESAERLYIRENKKEDEIATILDIHLATIYRWKKEDDWDGKKSIYQLSPYEISKIYLQLVKDFVLEMKKDPKKMLDSKITDAITKHLSNMRKIDPRSQYMGVALDLMKVIIEYLEKNDKKLRDNFIKHYDMIKEEFLKYIENR